MKTKIKKADLVRKLMDEEPKLAVKDLLYLLKHRYKSRKWTYSEVYKVYKKYKAKKLTEPAFELKNVPLPITHKDFDLDSWILETASKRYSESIDRQIALGGLMSTPISPKSTAKHFQDLLNACSGLGGVNEAVKMLQTLQTYSHATLPPEE